MRVYPRYSLILVNYFRLRCEVILSWTDLPALDSSSVAGKSLGRKAVLIGFWIAGYALGAFAWLVKAPVMQFVQNFGLSADTSQALLSGLAGSCVMVLAVVFLSFLSTGET